jgi:DNA polymerase-3 subunit delta
MRLKLEQLERTLSKLKGIYLISGDEPLQVGEAADAIRNASKATGYTTREVLIAGADFEWSQLSFAADSMSIFAEKKLIDLRLPTGKPGVEGARALGAYCQHLPEDTVLLITAPKLEKSALKTKWFETIDRAGVVVQVWPLEGAALIQWLQKRAQKKGLQIEEDGIKILASRVEGNLLAAAQEIEKLYVLYGKASISRRTVEQVVTDSSRFDVFKLTDCVLAGRASRTVRILNGLKAEGIAAPVVLWALVREARLLITIKTAINQGENKEMVFKSQHLWDKRKQLINAVLPRVKMEDLQQALLLGSKADRQIKGQERGDCWETLLSLCLLFPVRK